MSVGQQDLFAGEVVTPNDGPDEAAERLHIGSGAVLFRGALLPVADSVLKDIHRISAQTPFRQRRTPGGQLMAAAMTNCGAFGWVTDQSGYRYASAEPETGLAWLPMPLDWSLWSTKFAEMAGYPDFSADACLINRYAEGAGMGLHQDRDEADFRAPIVSLSLGAPIRFLWGGLSRQEKVTEVLLEHGDVLVWGGADRLRFHGVRPLRRFHHPLTGGFRYNLTFRRAQERR